MRTFVHASAVRKGDILVGWPARVCTDPEPNQRGQYVCSVQVGLTHGITCTLDPDRLHLIERLGATA